MAERTDGGMLIEKYARLTVYAKAKAIPLSILPPSTRVPHSGQAIAPSRTSIPRSKQDVQESASPQERSDRSTSKG